MNSEVKEKWAAITTFQEKKLLSTKRTSTKLFYKSSVASSINKVTLKTNKLAQNYKKQLTGLKTLLCQLMFQRIPELRSFFISPMCSKSLFSCNFSINSMLDFSN